MNREYTPLIDTRFYDEFDRKIVKYSQNLREYIEDILGVKDLENLHEQIDYSDTLKFFSLFKKVDTNIIEEFIDSVVRPILGNTEYLVQKTPNFRIILPNQDKIGQILCWHQGIWFGNGYGMRTIWTPLTKNDDTSTLHVASLKDSLQMTKSTYDEKWTYDKLDEMCSKMCEPMKVDVGETLLFTQEHLHGQVPNRSGKTRISFETRILLKDGIFEKKTPGGYFKKPFVDTKKTDNPELYKDAMIMQVFDGPMFHDSTLHGQYLIMDEYVKKNEIDVKFYCADINTINCEYIKYLMREQKYKNFIFPSMWAISLENVEEILNYKDCNIHFAAEELVCHDEESRDLALYYRKFTKN